MQLLDVARSRAQRLRSCRTNSEPARTGWPRATSNAHRLARSRAVDRTLEGGKHGRFNQPDTTRRTKWECSTSEAQCGGSRLPERARPARVVAQHEGRRRQAPAQIARGRHRARPTSRSEAESDPFRGSGGGPEDGVRRERPPFGRRARAADSAAPNAALRRPSPGGDRDDGHQQIHSDAAS